jgi:hypothetical protein
LPDSGRIDSPIMLFQLVAILARAVNSEQTSLATPRHY